MPTYRSTVQQRAPLLVRRIDLLALIEKILQHNNAVNFRILFVHARCDWSNLNTALISVPSSLVKVSDRARLLLVYLPCLR